MQEARWTMLVGEQKFALINARTRTYVMEMNHNGLFSLHADKSVAKKFDTMAEVLRFVATHKGPHIGTYNVVVLEPQSTPWRLVTELV